MRMRVPGQVDRIAARLDDALLRHGALCEIHMAVTIKYRASGLVPAAVRQLVDQHCFLTCFGVNAQQTRGFPTLGHGIQLPIVEAEAPRAAFFQVRQNADLTRGVEPQNPRRHPGPCWPGCAALGDEHSAVWGNSHAAWHGKAYSQSLDFVALRHRNITGIDPASRRCR